MINVRPLTATDAAAYRHVRLTVLQNDPLAFVTTAAEFEARTLESVAGQIAPKETAVTFGALLNGELVGILTLVREMRPSIRHRADIYGVGVLPRARGQGAGDALLRAATAQAQAWEGVSIINLAVMETQGTARRLYEWHGFSVWGTQPDAVRHGEQRYAEHWLSRPVESFSSGPVQG